MRAAGVDVDLVVCGNRRALSPMVELNAYRVVQEALTNAMKHAAGSKVCVLVEFGSGELGLTIRDFGGRQVPTGSTGTGIAGMHQRVALLGGSFSAARHPHGGFHVSAHLPLSDADS
jgi:signal transduction histidine kinase